MTQESASLYRCYSTILTQINRQHGPAITISPPCVSPSPSSLHPCPPPSHPPSHLPWSCSFNLSLPPTLPLPCLYALSLTSSSLTTPLPSLHRSFWFFTMRTFSSLPLSHCVASPQLCASIHITPLYPLHATQLSFYFPLLYSRIIFPLLSLPCSHFPHLSPCCSSISSNISSFVLCSPIYLGCSASLISLSLSLSL